MTKDTNTASGAADLQLADAYAKAHAMYCMEDLYGSSKSYTAELLKARIDARNRLAAALASTPTQPVAEPADNVVLNAAMRAIQQAIELIGAPTDERMRAVRRVLRGAVIVAEDVGKVAPQPSPTAQAAESVPAVATLYQIMAAARELHAIANPDGEPEWAALRQYEVDVWRARAERVLKAVAARAPAGSVQEDAARYRLLRRGQHWSVIDGIGNDLRAEALDAAVDAARKQGGA